MAVVLLSCGALEVVVDKMKREREGEEFWERRDYV